MSLPQWAIKLGFNPELWDSRLSHVSDLGCMAWRSDYWPDYTTFRVPNSIAPDVVKLIEERLPKPPSKEEAVKLTAELVNCLGSSGLAQFIRSVATLGEAPTARAVLQCAAHAFRTENGLEGAFAPALQRAEKWLEQSKEAAE